LLHEIEILQPQQLEKNLKATAHKTGKLGFTVDAAKNSSYQLTSPLVLGLTKMMRMTKVYM
jgi:hypothetical protein